MQHDPRQRVIAAALHVAAAERGGIDNANTAAEIAHANSVLDDALAQYELANSNQQGPDEA